MKQRKVIAILAMILVLVLCVGVFVACNPTPDDGGNNGGNGGNGGNQGNQSVYDYVDPATCEHVDADHNCVCDKCFTGMGHNIVDGQCTVCGNYQRVAGNYTYQDAASTIASVWNQHIYQTEDDSYPIDFITNGLYEFHFNGSKSGYEIWPVMASAYPEDITTEVKSEAKWGIPSNATKGYAYKIRLNQNAKWDDGTPINADTYVESYKLLMDPHYNNYRAADYTSGSVVFKNAKKYLMSAQKNYYVSMSLKYESLQAALDANEKVYFDCWDFWGAEGYVDKDGNACPQYVAIDDATQYDVTVEDFATENGNDRFSGKELYEAYYGTHLTDDLFMIYTENDDFGFKWEDGVGIYKTGDYEFVIVLEKSCSGFYLLYNLSGNWIVNVDKYKACTTVDSVTGEYKNTYNTSKETTSGYGPYKIKSYQEGKYIEFERNENWFGYSDHRFDCMYQTSRITCEQVSEASTLKQLFLKGQLETYGLQTEDYEQYGTSTKLYVSPGTTVFFMVLFSNEQTLANAQKSGVNKTILANDDFRKALSVAFDKAQFCRDLRPSNSAAYSVIGAYDIWNPITGEKYRGTEIAKKALVDYYGLLSGEDEDGVYYYFPGKEDVKYDLDDAVAAITGYNPTLAQELFLNAYNEWKKAGKIGDSDVIEIEYSASATSAFITKIINYMNDQIDKILKGTVLQGRVKFTISSPSGNNWADNLKSGKSQTALCGWKGGMLDPFNSMLYYLANDHQPYAQQWWDTSKVDRTMTLPVGENGANVELTMTLQDWAQCLTGDAKTVKGVSYNFGFEQVEDSVRLTIMAELEKAILETNYYIPMMQDGSAFLLSKKLEYALPASDFNAVLGRGGLTYIHYNYTDEAWASYVAEQGGELAY